MTAENSNYLFAKMSTVLSFPLGEGKNIIIFYRILFFSGVKRKDLVRTPRTSTNTPEEKRTKLDEIESHVEKKVREIIQGLKASHSKFTDPDFGPTESDPLGALCFYGNEPPAPAGTSKYPAPDSMKWERPQYASKNNADESEEEDSDEFDDDAKATVEEVYACL
jgi:hypothetical protein